jgi:hypothetical protein
MLCVGRDLLFGFALDPLGVVIEAEFLERVVERKIKVT